MKLHFQGDVRPVMEGIGILSDRLGFTVSEQGIPVDIAGGGSKLEVSGKNGAYRIGHGEKVEFFRGLALLVDRLKRDEETFAIIEQKKLDTCGIMLDVSRNAVLKPESVKDIFQNIALMGMNMAMLYTEDTYRMDDYPYFGYMRGAYTKEELKALDAYAAIFGIELIPCIQTLAHLATTLRWQYADVMADMPDILLIDEPETYRFIESMIKTVSECYTSRRIHVGMDEAHMVGLGQYYRKHGSQDRFEILSRHLGKVAGIAEKYGLQPMMWNDMFFRLGSKTGDYRDLDAKIPADIGERLPQVDMVYWDYYTEDEEAYRALLEMSKITNRKVIFAGGVWAWEGLGVNYQKTFAATVPGLKACHKQGIREVIATLWQNECAEVSMYSTLLGLQLFAEYSYYEQVDMAHLKERFRLCTGGDMDAFLLLQADDHDQDRCQLSTVDVSKQVLFQDVLQGLFDKNFSYVDLPAFYGKKAKALAALPHQGGMEYLFNYQRQLIRVLEMKCNLGLDIARLYHAGDRAGLVRQMEILKTLKDEVLRLKTLAMQVWYKNNKPFGFDSLDLKLGGVCARLDTAMIRLEQYLSGEICRIEELEEERLMYMYRGEGATPEKPLARASSYARICKASV